MANATVANSNVGAGMSAGAVVCSTETALFRRDVDIAEVLPRQRLHGAIGLYFLDRRVQLLAQRVVAFANAKRDAAAEDLVVANWLADELETLAFMPRQ